MISTNSKITLCSRIKEALAGEQEAWNIIYHRCYPHLFALSLKICGNTTLARDTVQDAFLVAITKLHQLENHESLLPWLKRILINCCYQALKKEKYDRLGSNFPENMHSFDDVINRHFDGLAQRNQLFHALSELPEVFRLTLMLRYLTDYHSYQQIAEILAVPVGTVRSRLSEGRNKLYEKWNLHEDSSDAEFQNSMKWSLFYHEVLSQIYQDSKYLKIFINHHVKDLKIVFTSGETTQGREILEQAFYDDFKYGSSIGSVDRVSSSGNISILELTNKNSKEYPDHCPPTSVIVAYRNKDMTERLHIHHSQRPKPASPLS